MKHMFEVLKVVKVIGWEGQSDPMYERENRQSRHRSAKRVERLRYETSKNNNKTRLVETMEKINKRTV